MLRAGTAGNSASRSSVSVNMQLTRSSASRWLRARTSRISSSVAARMASESFAPTVAAPRSAIRPMGAAFNQSARGAPQRVRFRLRQPPVLAGLQPAQPQRPERDALELDHPMPDGLAHPADLALAALVDRDLQAVRRQPPD